MMGEGVGKPWSAVSIGWDAKAVTRALLGVWLVLLAAHVLGYVYLNYTSAAFGTRGLHRIDFDAEQSIPCWFSTLLIAAAALVCTAVAKRMWDRRWRGAGSFVFLAAALWWVSLDENLSFHEKLTGPMQQFIGEDGWLVFAWVVVGGPVAIAMGALMLPALLRLPRRIFWTLVLAAATYVGGAVGMEMAASFVATRITWHASELYSLCVVIEESAEMIGMILMIQGMTLQLNRVCNPAAVEAQQHLPTHSQPSRVPAAAAMTEQTR